MKNACKGCQKSGVVRTNFRSHQNSGGEELPTITYHRKCRSIFSMKRDLDNICKERIQCNEPELSERRSIRSIRESPTKSTTYKRVCMFCDKFSKYAKGKDVLEKLIQCIDLRADENVLSLPTSLSRLQLAKEVGRLQQLRYKSQASLMDDIRRLPLEVRKAICYKENEMSWPPKPSQLTEEEINLPDEVTVFLATLLTGNSKYLEEPCSSKVQRLVNSFGQDMVYGLYWYVPL